MSTPLIQTTTEYNPFEEVAVTLTREQWATVLYWLEYGANYHHAKMTEWMAVCDDKRMAEQIAGKHYKQMEQAENLRQIVEEILHPKPTTETEE